MKKTAIALLAVIIMAPAATTMAQDDTRSDADAKRMEMRKDRKKKMEAQKVAYLTREMDLTPKEAEVFWPVYNNYKAELEGLDGKLETMSQSRGEGEERYKIDPRDFDRQMQTKFDLERNRIDIDEQYFRHFKEVLPADKLVRFYEADVRFKRELLQKLGSDRKEGMDAREMERRRKMGERNIKQVQPVEQKRK